MFAVAKQSLKKWKNNLVQAKSVAVKCIAFEQRAIIESGVWSSLACIRTKANGKSAFENVVFYTRGRVQVPIERPKRAYIQVTEWTRELRVENSVLDGVVACFRCGSHEVANRSIVLISRTLPHCPSPKRRKYTNGWVCNRVSRRNGRSGTRPAKNRGDTLSLTTIIPPITCNGVARRFPGG